MSQKRVIMATDHPANCTCEECMALDLFLCATCQRMDVYDELSCCYACGDYLHEACARGCPNCDAMHLCKSCLVSRDGRHGCKECMPDSTISRAERLATLKQALFASGRKYAFCYYCEKPMPLASVEICIECGYPHCDADTNECVDCHMTYCCMCSAELAIGYARETWRCPVCREESRRPSRIVTPEG